MTGKATTLLAIAIAAALGIYLKWRVPRRAASDVLKPKGAPLADRAFSDDDGLADIIKRLMPALDRARKLYRY